jgi:hypothetical protein
MNIPVVGAEIAGDGCGRPAPAVTGFEAILRS